MSIEAVIDKFENEAVDRRDLERAIRLNWLRNAYRMGRIDDDDAIRLVQMIHYLEPDQWPRPDYGGQNNEKTHTDDRHEGRIDSGSDERKIA